MIYGRVEPECAAVQEAGSSQNKTYVSGRSGTAASSDIEITNTIVSLGYRGA